MCLRNTLEDVGRIALAKSGYGHCSYGMAFCYQEEVNAWQVKIGIRFIARHRNCFPN